MTGPNGVSASPLIADEWAAVAAAYTSLRTVIGSAPPFTESFYIDVEMCAAVLFDALHELLRRAADLTPGGQA